MAKRSRLKRKGGMVRRSTKPKLIYWKGAYQNVGKLPSPEQKARMMKRAGVVKGKIISLLDLWGAKRYKGELKKDRELVNIVVLKDKLNHFRFMQAYTDWNAHGYWKENGKVFDEDNAIIQAQFADTVHEKVGTDLIALLNEYNELVVGERSLYAYTSPVEETTLI